MKISFHGAVKQVTGSCFLLEVLDRNGQTHHLLFDCGMFQGERLCGTTNFEDFGFDPKNIEAVFVTHPHADHTARLPKLMKEGFTGPIYFTHPALALTKLILQDTFHIMQENAERCEDPILYTQSDVDAVEARAKTVNYHELIQVAPGIDVMFHDAGHVLGSAYISVKAEGKTLVFSGDIGNDSVPILPDTESISTADVVVCESTYGNRVHEGRPERTAKLRVCLEKTIADKGVLLIPTFSIERTQELLYEMDQILLGELKTQMPIYLDSPLAIRATAIYRHFKQFLKFDASILAEPDRDFFSFPNLKETLGVEESKRINSAPAPKVIIAGSGMMSGGRILHHALRYLPDPKNTLLMIGYQADHTLGRQIFDGAKQVHIFGQSVSVNAHVQAIGSFSAHGDRQKLTRWLQPTDGKIPQTIFLVHGDEDAKVDFAAHLKIELKTNIVIPKYHESFEIEMTVPS